MQHRRDAGATGLEALASFNVNFAGIAGFNYTIQRAPSPSGPWSPVGSAAAGADGTGVCLDTNAPATTAFYRTVYP